MTTATSDTSFASRLVTNERARALLREPSTVAILVWLAMLPLIRPFGNYPLNDDWHYARIAKNFALKGHFALDSPVASALVGQSLTVWPVIRLFGFSHVALRAVTYLLSLGALVLLDRLMKLGSVAPRVRLVALLSIAFNPLFFYTSLSFMTEFYGYVPGLLAAYVWMTSRKMIDARGNDAAPAVSWTAAILAGLLFGFAFWVRQFCAAIYPALPGATVLGLLAARRYRALFATLPRLAASAAIYGVILAAFFPWAKATGNYTPQFQSPLGHLSTWEGDTFYKHSMMWLVYMATFNAPLLLLVPWRSARWRELLATSVVLISAAYLGRYMLRDVRMDWVHPHMPFLGNIIEDTGLGPNTLSDVYWAKRDRPRFSPETWMVIEAVCVHAVALFAPLLLAGRTIYRRFRGSIEIEVLLFALLVMLGSVFLSIQAYKMETLDRYHFPSLLAMPLAIAVAVGATRRDAPLENRSRIAWVALAIAPLAWFSVAGLHDYFRWNDARWALVREAEHAGGTTSTIEGGYELDGWLHYDDIKEGHPIYGCIGGHCRCDYATWYTQDCSYHIGMSTYGGYEPIRVIMPSYWLTPGPAMVLSKRLH